MKQERLSNMVKILMRTSLGYNGVASVTMNYCNHMPSDISYTFLLTNGNDEVRNDYKEYIEQREWKIEYIPNPIKNFLAYAKKVAKILNQGDYDVFYINGNSSLMMIDVLAVKLSGYKGKIVTHCHSTSSSNNFLHKILKPIFKFADVIKVACSNKAGDWAYGKKTRYLVITNGVDYKKYSYDKMWRKEIREEFDVVDKQIILHVGTFNKAKNHTYLIKIAKKLSERCKNFIWFFIGEGELLNQVRQEVEKYGLQDTVCFLGNRSDINKIYSAADVFLLPSLYEGLPVVLIEAQVSGLSTIISSNITSECDISGNIVRLGISEDEVDNWTIEIEKAADKCFDRKTSAVTDDFMITKNVEKLLNLLR